MTQAEEPRLERVHSNQRDWWGRLLSRFVDQMECVNRMMERMEGVGLIQSPINSLLPHRTVDNSLIMESHALSFPSFSFHDSKNRLHLDDRIHLAKY